MKVHEINIYNTSMPLPKQKSALKRKQETNSKELSSKKVKKGVANKNKVEQKVRFDLKKNANEHHRKNEKLSLAKKKHSLVLKKKRPSLSLNKEKNLNKGYKVGKLPKNKFAKKGKQNTSEVNKGNSAGDDKLTCKQLKGEAGGVQATLGSSKLKKISKHKRLTRVEWKLTKRKTKNDFELMKKAKELGAFIQCNENRKGKYEALCEQLHKLIKGKVNMLIYAHDTSRTIQTLVSYGTEAIRNELFEEMKGELLKMIKSKYAKHFVKKMLMHGTPGQKETIISSFYGDVVNLMKHSEAAVIVEHAYSETAKGPQRAKLTEEFYGPTYRLFKNQQISSLSQLLEEKPSEKKSVLAYMKEKLIPLTEKSVIRHSLVHHILNEYFTYCQVSDKEELIESLRESVIFFLHTKDGSRVAMQCLWHGTIKDRKSILKSFKTHVTKICKEEFGYMVLLAVFDCIDDTVLVDKVILKEIINNLSDIICDSYGRKVIMYLLSPRDSIHCHPDIMKILSHGDQNLHSKKEKAVRYSELLNSISNPLLNFLAENTDKMLYTPSNNIVAQMIIKHVVGDFSNVYKKIANLVAEPFKNSKQLHIVEHTAGHMFLKTLLNHDKEKKDGEELFCEYLMKTVPEASYKDWINCNRGTFFLARILETDKSEIVDYYKRILIPLKKELMSKTFPGAEVLLKKL